MKGLVIAALVLLCVAERGLAYRCYTCTMALSDKACNTVTNCTSPTPFCGTAIVKGLIITYISKYCSAVCLPASQNITLVSATEDCCASDLCNTKSIGGANGFFDFSGARGLSTSWALLLAAIGALLSLLHVL